MLLQLLPFAAILLLIGHPSDSLLNHAEHTEYLPHTTILFTPNQRMNCSITLRVGQFSAKSFSILLIRLRFAKVQ
ncbi:hypothetical protein IWZ03DRAFT_368879 [Phyllosticta citriasiana]|uniref:Secreted protein n=1 Tax=Phyllosticta citriasiana TaxID=595635 RepID=A0ABR1KTZ5_9PEZI